MKGIIELEEDRMEWARRTFPEATATSSLYKCREEIREIEEMIFYGNRDASEYADAIMCLFDSAARLGISPREIMEAYEKKIAINKTRVWRRNSDNTYSHIMTLKA